MPSAGESVGSQSAGGSSGMPGGSAGGGMSDSSASGAGGGESLDEIFNKSLGDFDGEMESERSGMDSTGRGSGQSADRREGGDATAAGGGGMNGGPGGMVSIPSSAAAGGAAGGQASTGTGSADGAEGQQDAAGGGADGAPESTEEGAGNENAQAANIPDDIPLEGNAEDQVARQIREAAMAEKDPVIRDALWDEYRKHQGIK
jgi:hypothetical protein